MTLRRKLRSFKPAYTLWTHNSHSCLC